MSDLILQDFGDLAGKVLVQALSNEKERMLGEQKFHVKKMADKCLCSSSFPGAFGNVRKTWITRWSIRWFQARNE
jgi:hypothetical protein